MFNAQIEAALAANAAAIMTWEVLPMLVDPEQTYDFTWDSDAGQVLQALTTYAACLVCLPLALLPCSPRSPPPSPALHSLITHPWSCKWACLWLDTFIPHMPASMEGSAWQLVLAPGWPACDQLT